MTEALLERVRREPPEGLMSPAECEELADLAGLVSRSKAIVELGSYRGLSSAFLAGGAEAGNGARVTCVDLWPQPQPRERDQAHADRQRGALEAFLGVQHRLGWPVTALQGTAVQVALMWHQPVGLLFHDAGHDRLSVQADLEAWLPHLARGAIVAVHDYLGDDMQPTEVAIALDGFSGRLKFDHSTDKMWVGFRT